MTRSWVIQGWKKVAGSFRYESVCLLFVMAVMAWYCRSARKGRVESRRVAKRYRAGHSISI